MRILKDRFCGLSKARDFQNFLKSVAPDLYRLLINHLQLGEGCQSNKKKMIEIYESIKDRNILGKLETFLANNHPNMVIIDTNIEKPKNENTVVKIKAESTEELYDKMNHHKVFDIYRPRLLTIPQRKIIIGPTKSDVKNSINRFVSGKVGVDHLILKGPELWHGYVEFFDARFLNHIEGLDHSQRPITVYKRKNDIQ